MKRDFYTLNVLAKLMVLLRQLLFNLSIAAIAEAILMRISAVDDHWDEWSQTPS